ncbi:MAG: glycosyltransferase family 4 protein [Patescibacteria group bacterium]|nr:glycosyltransferase family 4 protein [Patescibacteria group bacterium]
MKRIAFFHNALGKTDGVSLEVDKWRKALEEMGHTVFYCAGNDDVSHVYCIPELSFLHPQTYKILRNATVNLVDFTEQELEKAIWEQKDIIKQQLLRFIDDHMIEVLIPNNLMSVGYHLPALIALWEVIKETKLPTISHNHDFYFEESGEVHPTCRVAQEILDTYAPAHFPHVQNLVINRLAQKALKERKGIDARVVPNVFDFDQPRWQQDEYNSTFRSDMGVGEDDLVFLQATRVMNRKGIELAIDVVGLLGTPEFRKQFEGKKLYNKNVFPKKGKIVLLCVGRIEKFGATDNYVDMLKDRASEKGVDIRFVGDYMKHSRGTKNGRKVYSLWDSYVYADFVTYPSYWEGWGNQFIEAVFAKLPILLYEYPVFVSDLRADGFQTVSLGDRLDGKDHRGLAVVDESKVRRAAEEIVKILTSAEKYKAMTEHNFTIGKAKYSLQTLRTIITDLLSRC